MKRFHPQHAARPEALALGLGLRILATLACATVWVLVVQGLGAR